MFNHQGSGGSLPLVEPRGNAPGTFMFYLLCLLLFGADALAAQPEPAARTIEVRGDADVFFRMQTVSQPLVKDQELAEGDIITTQPDSRVALLFGNQIRVKLNENSTLHIHKTASTASDDNPTHQLEVPRGQLWSQFKGNQASRLLIRTPAAEVGIRGTDWFLQVEEGTTPKTTVTVRSGQVRLANAQGEIFIGNEEQGIAEADKPLRKIRVTNLKQGTQWISFLPENLRYFSFKPERSGCLQEPSAACQTLVDAERHFNAGRLSQSRSLWNRLLTDSALACHARVALGLLAIKQGEWQSARQWAQASQGERCPVVPATILRFAWAAHDNRLNEAANILQEGRNRTGDDRTLAIAALHLALLRGDLERAGALGQELWARHPDDPELLTIYKDVLFLNEERPLLEQLTQRSLTRHPGSALARWNRGWYLMHGAGNDLESWNAFGPLLEEAGEDPELLIEVANLLRRRGEYDQAQALFDRLLDQGIIRAELFYHAGLLANQRGELPEAARLFRQAEAREGALATLAGSGMTGLRLGEDQAAQQSLLENTLVSPEVAENHLHLAVAHYRLGLVEAALEALDHAILADPNDAVPHLVKSAIHNDLHQPAQALLASREAEKRLPFRKKGDLDLTTTAKDGMSHAGYALNALGLDFWSYKKSIDILMIDPFDPGAHLFPALVNSNVGNASVAQGEFAQAAMMDPALLMVPNRFLPLMEAPAQNLSLSSALTRYQNHWGEQYAVRLSGQTTAPQHFSYFVNGRLVTDNIWPGSSIGQLNLPESGEENRSWHGAALAGWKLNWRQDLYARILMQDNNRTVNRYWELQELPYLYYSAPSVDFNRYRHVEGGYHYRFGPTSHGLLRPYWIEANNRIHATGFVDPFANYLTPDRFRSSMERLGLGATAASIPAPFIPMIGKLLQVTPALLEAEVQTREAGIQAKHFLNTPAGHLSYGLEFLNREQQSLSQARTALNGQQLELELAAGTMHQRAWNLFARDRLLLHPDLLLDIGLAVQENRVEEETGNTLKVGPALQPRLGLAWQWSPKDTLRLAYQEHAMPSDPAFPSQVRLGSEDVMGQVALQPGIGRLESSDVAGILPFSHSAFGRLPGMQDTRMRWEREWDKDLFHFMELGHQKARGLGEFDTLFSAINWIPHPQWGVGLQTLLLHMNYNTPPFLADLLSDAMGQIKVTYVDPQQWRVALWQEYYTAKPAWNHQTPDLAHHTRLNLAFDWNSPDRLWTIKASGYDLFPGKGNTLPGIISPSLVTFEVGRHF